MKGRVQVPVIAVIRGGVVSVWGWRVRLGHWEGRTEHFRDRYPDSEGGAHDVGAD